MDEKKNEVVDALGLSELKKCRHAGARISDYERGEIICSVCGQVLYDEILDTRPEWRTFCLEDWKARSRVGAPSSYSKPSNGLGTQIGSVTYDSHGREIKASERWKYRRLRRLSALTYDSENIARALAELDRLAGKFPINKLIANRASEIYRKAQKRGLIQGRSVMAAAAAALYLACRENGNPITLREIALESLSNNGSLSKKKKKKEIACCARALSDELKLLALSPDPVTYLPKISGSAKISGITEGLAARILDVCKKKRLSLGKDPLGLAAAAVHFACVLNKEERITQKQIARLAGVTDTTLRNHCKALACSLKQFGFGDFVYALKQLAKEAGITDVTTMGWIRNLEKRLNPECQLRLAKSRRNKSKGRARAPYK